MRGDDADADAHEHQFPEEETPEGVRILYPCLLCGLPAADGLLVVKQERDAWAAEAAEAVRLLRGDFDEDEGDEGDDPLTNEELRELNELERLALDDEDDDEAIDVDVGRWEDEGGAG